VPSIAFNALMLFPSHIVGPTPYLTNSRQFMTQFLGMLMQMDPDFNCCSHRLSENSLALPQVSFSKLDHSAIAERI